MLKAAIVGCGLISTRKFIPIFQRIRHRAKVVGICDLNEKIVKEVGSRFAISNTYTDFSEMLLQQKPDVVVICTPPATHTKLAIEALGKGAHVLVEKPMALTPVDCQKMVDKSNQCGRKLGVMHNQVFNPAFEKACNLVAGGKIGKFLGMRIFLMTSVHDMTVNPNHWAHKLPGGVLGETGPHAVYMSLAFLNKVTDIKVQLKKQLSEYPWSIAEDFRIDLIASNGVSSITLVYSSNQTAAEVEIIGSKEMLKVDLQSRILVNHNRSVGNELLSARALINSVIGNVYQTMSSFALNGIKHLLWKKLDGHYVGVIRFIDYVSNNIEYPANGEKGKEVVEVMERIVQRIQDVT